jgi:ABC-type antimicrobial peptide transport system permease subunit
LSDFDFKAAKAEPIYNRLKSLPQVKRVGWIETEPWTDLPTSFGVADEGKNGRGVQVCVTEIDQDCMDMFGFEVVEQYCEPGNGMYWLTESAKRKFNVSKERPYINEVGYNQYDKTYIVKSEIRFPVCGVVKDFRTSATPRDASKYENVIQINEKAPASSYIMLELDGQSGTDGNALKSIKAVCNEVAMEITGAKRDVGVRTLEGILDGRLYGLRNKRKVVLGFMFLSLLISALGMLAMSVSYTEQQSKQIALRKVMGATVEGAAWELSRPFLLLSLLSSVIAVPISIKGMREYLEPFYYRIDFPWWVLVVAVLISLSVAILSVLWQTLSVARRNPVESIRTE